MQNKEGNGVISAQEPLQYLKPKINGYRQLV